MISNARSLSETFLQEVASLNTSQTRMDGWVSGFVEQSTNWRSVAAMMVGGVAYRLGRVGVMALFGAQQAAPLLGLVSRGVGLALEASVWEGVGGILNLPQSPFFKGGSRPEEPPFEKGGQGGFWNRWRTSFLQFGLLKLGGAAVLGQNVFVQHLIQDTATVVGHRITARLGLTSSPEGNLAQQYLHAEAMNLQMGLSLSVAHPLVPGVSFWERSLEVSARSRIFPRPPLTLKGGGRELAEALVGIGEGHSSFQGDEFSSRDSLQGPLVVHMSASKQEGMVPISGGRFVMGAGDIENAQPVREVVVDGFYMRQTHETNENYERFVSDPEQRREPWGLYRVDPDNGRLEIVERARTERELEQRANWFHRSRGDGTENQSPWALVKLTHEGRRVQVIERGDSSQDLMRRKGELIEAARGRQKTALQSSQVVRVGPADTPPPIYRVIRGIPNKWKADAPPDHPVVNVNLFEAMMFAHALGGRLPTEAEWEYAMRGPEVDIQRQMREEGVPYDQFARWVRGREIRARYGEARPLGRYENFVSGGRIFTDPGDPDLQVLLREGVYIGAGRVFPSETGEYDDLAIWGSVVTQKREVSRSVREAVFNAYGVGDFGNVWDLTMDAYHGSYEELGDENPVRPVDLSDFEKGIMLRGGSGFSNNPHGFRLASRDDVVTDRCDWHNGFRWLVPFPQDSLR
ncbi:MAG: SUMF1/EgtB/PvdO family nonheme iron enzyme [bacterium]